tara:strand:+ start:372 stop:590 length:219 start_codon:yes stop_codon:yes gene_type:complete
MNRAITNALNKHRIGQERRVFIITGTERTADGPELNVTTERAFTEAEAWQQAVAHAAGTAFTPETIEERKTS